MKKCFINSKYNFGKIKSKEKRPLLEIVNRDHKSYFIKSNQADQKFKLTQNSLKKYLKSIRELKFCSFDDLMKVHNSVWQQKVLNSTKSKNYLRYLEVFVTVPNAESGTFLKYRY